jgi:hypothetical protein
MVIHFTQVEALHRQNQGTFFLDTRLRGYDGSWFFNDE